MLINSSTTLLCGFVSIFVTTLFLLVQCGKGKKGPQRKKQAGGIKMGGPGIKAPTPAGPGRPMTPMQMPQQQQLAPPGKTREMKGNKPPSMERKFPPLKPKNDKKPMPSALLKSEQPKFAAIRSDLVSYQDANSKLRRTKPGPPPPRPTPPRPPAPPQPSHDEKLPENGDIPVDKDNELYDTLNFVKGTDVFNENKKTSGPGAAQGREDDDNGHEEDDEQSDGDEHKEREGVQAGMVAKGNDDYETLADIGGDIFAKH